MTYHELEKTKATRLREMLKEVDPEFKGASGLKKDQLVEVLADKLGVQRPHKVVAASDKGAIKARIRELKQAKAAAVAARDRAELRRLRRELHGLRRRLRRAARQVA